MLSFLSDGELRRAGSSQKRYNGINDIRRDLLDNRQFLYVRIVTPSRTEMGEAWFPGRVRAIGEHLADLLDIDVDEITAFTFEKGQHPANRGMPHGMVTWQYAPAQPVQWTDGDWVNARVVRVRWQDEILFQHVWCPPAPEPTSSRRFLRGRQEDTSPVSAGVDEALPVPTNAIRVDQPLECPADTELLCSPEICDCDDVMGNDEDPPSTTRTENALKPRQTDDEEDDFIPIIQNEFVEPHNFAMGGRAGWWEQMRDLVSWSPAALRSQQWRRADGTMAGRGFPSSSYHIFDDEPGAAGTGPMWGCTSVIVVTNNGM